MNITSNLNPYTGILDITSNIIKFNIFSIPELIIESNDIIKNNIIANNISTINLDSNIYYIFKNENIPNLISNNEILNYISSNNSYIFSVPPPVITLPYIYTLNLDSNIYYISSNNIYENIYSLDDITNIISSNNIYTYFNNFKVI